MAHEEMTIKELSKLFWLNREIEEQQERLAELENLALYKKQCVAGMPKSGRLADTTAQYAVETADLRAIIQANLDKILPERRRLERFIQKINSPDARIIFRLRHINGMTWEQIGGELGYTPSGVWRKYKKQIDKLSKQSK